MVLAANFLGGLVKGFAVPRAHGDAASLSGEGFSRGPADPLTGRGYDCDSVSESGFHRSKPRLSRTIIFGECLFVLRLADEGLRR